MTFAGQPGSNAEVAQMVRAGRESSDVGSNPASAINVSSGSER